MKKIIITIIVLSSIGIIWYLRLPQQNQNIPISQCEIKEITFYYLDGCEWCNKVKSEGALEKIEELGIKINKINAAIGPVRHKFTGVPTFIIDNKVYEGYRTFEDLKALLKCPFKEEVKEENAYKQKEEVNTTDKEFYGQKGEKVALENGQVKLDISSFNGNTAKFYNLAMPSGKTIYFFVVKDKNGVYRAAANACQVCYGIRKGFHQENNEIVCDNCGNRYPVEKIATEKGGCNPGPINPNLKIENGELTIKQAELEEVSELF